MSAIIRATGKTCTVLHRNGQGGAYVQIHGGYRTWFRETDLMFTA